MINVSGFAFASKQNISISGAAFRITATAKNQSYKLYRQFENFDKELLITFNADYPALKLQKYFINTKNRNVYSIIEHVYSQLSKSYSKDEDIFELINSTSSDKSIILKIWNKAFSSKEFISDNYQGYMFIDSKMRIWIYDIIPANSMLSEIDDKNPLPTTGKTVTYSIESLEPTAEIYSQRFVIPEIIEAELELFNIFEQDKYLYHIALKYNGRYIWGKFTSNKSSRRTKFLQESSIVASDLIANINPDINKYPNLNPKHKLFNINDNPPILSATELMETELKITRIMTDIEDYNNFNAISIETKTFKSSNFPQTFSLIYPHR